MKKLVIDIETVGIPWEEHDPYVREYLIKGQTEDGAEETKRAGGLSPFRGRIVAIGVINIEDGRSCALYEVPGQTDVRVEKAGLRTYISGTEKQILGLVRCRFTIHHVQRSLVRWSVSHDPFGNQRRDAEARSCRLPVSDASELRSA
jgi:hypothetical protein